VGVAGAASGSIWAASADGAPALPTLARCAGSSTVPVLAALALHFGITHRLSRR
jgi:hypothetical protein